MPNTSSGRVLEKPETEEDSADEAPDTGTPSPSPRRSLRAAVAVVAVVVIGLSVCAGVFGWKLKERNEIDAAGRAASATAQNYAVTLTSIDSRHIDQNFTDVLNGATGEFKDMYSKSSEQLKQLLIDNKAVSKGKVVGVAIRSASTERVEVMLFVDQEVTNAASPDPRLDRSRIVMTMQRAGDRWLAGKVEMV
ncbi:hypothetical protein [Nocardia wallacei]|uniref:hypothetical protein n=1 Tax=Nocardia wallacei TaxID=480035 RepID=UPI002456D00D|nr:hypothetical protein [Nocardia wallacei]